MALWAVGPGCRGLLGFEERGGLSDGAPCDRADDCATGFCLDGVCCESACDGLCDTCTAEGSAGLCVLRPQGASCGSGLICDAAGTCRTPPVGTGEPCVAADDCESDVCIDNVCCERACENDESCTPEGLCLPNNGSPCSAPSECASGHCEDEICCEQACASGQRCSSDGVCRSLLGETCESDTQCDSQSCADGFCCDTPCGACQRCDVQPGTCSPLPRDTDPDGDCGASCDGAGACRTVESVTAGYLHTCARLSDGALKCWGGAGSLQYLLGSEVPSGGVVTVAGIDGLLAASTDVSAGETHSCAVLSNGAVRCWGAGATGQLGDGTQASSNTPVAVIGINGSGAAASAVSVAAAGTHSCAVLSNGAVRCWGGNTYGQLGDGGNILAAVPSPVSGIDGASASAVHVVAGKFHSCALLTNGAVRCWGRNDLGQLGNGGNLASNVPVQVSGIDGVSASAVLLASGWYTACVVLSAGGVRCWGWGAHGQLGNGSFEDATTPVEIPGLAASGLSGGGEHFCSWGEGAPFRCWGNNDAGQLGSPGPSSAVPLVVPGLGTPADVKAAGAGWLHQCVVSLSGEVACWGDNLSGQVTSGGASLDL
ncbi:MAG: hypothetical protein R3F14_30030 [Polyangiaceae bacterium]